MYQVPGGVENRAAYSSRAGWHGFCVTLLSLMVAGITACGGSGGGDSEAIPSVPSSPTQPPANPVPIGRGTLQITVTDLLGAPIAGAKVRVWTYWTHEDKSTVTDAAGVAEVRDVIASTVTLSASSAEAYGSADGIVVTADSVRRVTLVARPSVFPAKGPTGGVAGAVVSPPGAGDDGRTLEFSLSLLAVPDPQVSSWIVRNGNQVGGGFEELRILPCSPNLGNDAQRFQPDCVSGGDGFDAAYDGTVVAIEYRAGPGYDAIQRPEFISALLLDQSANAIIDDPADRRLFAARYFLGQTPVTSQFPLAERVALAAFAADDTVHSQPALIPQKPATVFPVENPRYTADGRELLPDVDALAVLEGGAAPLFDAIDRMLDFAGGHRDARSSLIVVTNGRDDTCGDRAQCRTRLDALARKSRERNVGIVAVGLEGPSGAVDYETLSALALSGSGGAVFRAADPLQLAPIMQVALMDQMQLTDVVVVKIRIRSEEPGTFVSGRSVIGQVRVAVCPFDCVITQIPFAVRIP